MNAGRIGRQKTKVELRYAISGLNFKFLLFISQIKYVVVQRLQYISSPCSLLFSMPKVRYSACRTQGARRQRSETTKSLEPPRLGYYQNLVVWNKVDPVAPVAPIERIVGGEFFSIKHSNIEV